MHWSIRSLIMREAGAALAVIWLCDATMLNEMDREAIIGQKGADSKKNPVHTKYICIPTFNTAQQKVQSYFIGRCEFISPPIFMMLLHFTIRILMNKDKTCQRRRREGKVFPTLSAELKMSWWFHSKFFIYKALAITWFVLLLITNMLLSLIYVVWLVVFLILIKFALIILDLVIHQTTWVLVTACKAYGSAYNVNNKFWMRSLSFYHVPLQFSIGFSALFSRTVRFCYYAPHSPTTTFYGALPISDWHKTVPGIFF